MSLSLHHLAPHESWQNLPDDQQSKGSDASLRTVHRTPSPYHRSTHSQGSVSSSGLRVRNENVPLGRNASQISLPLASRSTSVLLHRRVSQPVSPQPACGNGSSQPKRMQSTPSFLHDAGPLYDVDLNAGSADGTQDKERSFERWGEQASDNGFSFDSKRTENLSIPWPIISVPVTVPGTTVTQAPASALHLPFKEQNLIQRFRRVFGRQRQRYLTVRKERWTLDDFDEEHTNRPDLVEQPQLNGHRKASSWTAFSSVKPNSSALTIEPVPAMKEYAHKRSKFLRRNRDSRISNRADRNSSGSGQRSLKTVELAASARAIQRRKVLEELFDSEKSYVADLKVLLHVYLTILDSGPKAIQAARPEFSRNVGDMLRLHEELLLQIKAKLQNSMAYPGARAMWLKMLKSESWQVSDSPGEMELNTVTEKTTGTGRPSKEFFGFGRSKKQRLMTTAGEAADIASLFEHMLERLFIYEEYAAKYESMLRNMASLSKTMPNWAAYERGIEALMNSLVPQSSGIEDSRKCLTLEDLLIKPIQRVCRYPLLFAELQRHTPAIDDEKSQKEVEKVLFRLREMAKEINTATNDEKTQARIQRSWHLQDLLAFPATSQPALSIRALGHASLCGVLYVAYQSEREVQGNYMLCALFSSYLLLAQPKPGNSRFEIAAILSLSDLQLDQADSGRGLQCHTAPFSWKVVFELDQQLYDFIFCACTAREEDQWKTTLHERSNRKKDNREWRRGVSFENPGLYLEIRSLGPVFGQPGTLMHRQSIQRAATLNSRKQGCQVIIRNTSSTKQREDFPVTISETVGRSQSFLSTYKIPILAPGRADRQRVEQAMASVWTRDQLPYPGMAGHRRGSLITSATNVMRRLSRASTTTTSTTTSAMSISCTSIAETSSQSAYTAASRMPGNYHSFAHMPDHCQSLASAPELECSETGKDDEDTAFALEKTLASPIEFRPISNRKNAARSSEISGGSTMLPRMESLEVEQGRGKLRKPKTLFKPFSTEALRSWLH